MNGLEGVPSGEYPTEGRLGVTTDVVTVGPGVTLEKDGSFGASDAIGALSVDSGGTVTHSAYDSGEGRLRMEPSLAGSFAGRSAPSLHELLRAP